MINFHNSTPQTNEFNSLVKLLGQGDGTEIAQFEIAKDRMFFINPSLRLETYELYYIVKGKLQFGDTIFTTFDYIDVNHITESYGLKALEDTVFISFSSNTGEFDNTSKFNRVLEEKLEAIQQKDHYTYEHCIRVKSLAFEIGEHLKLSDTDIKHLVIAAYFHDVGKIKTPDSILNKAGSLTDHEYDEMKQHVQLSHDIVEEAIVSDVAAILVLHHERLDGSGYPKGLKGDDIPYLGKILAVLDSYDAMTTDRVYKKGKDTETAIKELYSLSHQYDISIVKALDEIIHKKKFL